MARGRGGWGELGRRGLVWVYTGWDMTEKKKVTREEMRSDKGQKSWAKVGAEERTSRGSYGNTATGARDWVRMSRVHDYLVML